MTLKNKILVIGQYTPEQLGKLQTNFEAILLKNGDAIPDVPFTMRETITAIAFKGHKPMELDNKKFDLLPKLKIISNFGVGYDAIDIDEATARGVKVTNTPDVLNDDVADIAVGMLIALSREFSMGAEWIKSGDWAKFGEMPLNRTISGKTAGILGLGRIGSAIAERLSSFKMDIHYYARSKKNVPEGWTYHADPVALAIEVDFLFVTLVGGKETSKFASAEVIRALGPDGILVNISRGSTVDEDALIQALETKAIRGAALDVFASEPDINPKFLELDNVFLQPHQGSGTVETREAMSKLQRDNLSNFFADRSLLTPVN